MKHTHRGHRKNYGDVSDKYQSKDIINHSLPFIILVYLNID